MKKLLILFALVGIFTFSVGASPQVKSSQKFVEKQNLNLEQSSVLNNTVAEKHLTKHDIGICLISVSNVLGQDVLVKKVLQSYISISTDSLPNGLYFVKLEYSDKTKEYLKFAKTDKNKNLQFFGMCNLQNDTFQYNGETIKLHKTQNLFVSNIGYIDHLIFIKPFERGWSYSYIKRT